MVVRYMVSCFRIGWTITSNSQRYEYSAIPAYCFVRMLATLPPIHPGFISQDFGDDVIDGSF